MHKVEIFTGTDIRELESEMNRFMSKHKTALYSLLHTAVSLAVIGFEGKVVVQHTYTICYYVPADPTQSID